MAGVRVVVFFFQAEDGIRDLVRSRGLGDVYKRQLIPRDLVYSGKYRLTDPVRGLEVNVGQLVLSPTPVYYTHLTLPTIYTV